MSFLEAYLYGLMVIMVLMIVLWMISLALKNSSIVDVFWGTGFVIVYWVYYAVTPEGYLLRKLLLGVLVTLWGLRLSIYIWIRNWGKAEDFRYQKWRQGAGRKWWYQSLFQVFLLQGALLWVISAPLLGAQIHGQPERLTAVDIIGGVTWVVGFYFETVGDIQLAHFKNNPSNKGKVMDQGVWRYTRHPNYFGDSMQWWGYYLVALGTGVWWAVFSPFIMTVLLLKVSGVALLEKTMETRAGYKEYTERTSSFIPWFPRKGKIISNEEHHECKQDTLQ